MNFFFSVQWLHHASKHLLQHGVQSLFSYYKPAHRQPESQVDCMNKQYQTHRELCTEHPRLSVPVCLLFVSGNSCNRFPPKWVFTKKNVLIIGIVCWGKAFIWNIFLLSIGNYLSTHERLWETIGEMFWQEKHCRCVMSHYLSCASATTIQ